VLLVLAAGCDDADSQPVSTTVSDRSTTSLATVATPSTMTTASSSTTLAVADRRIVFTSGRGETGGLYIVQPDGTDIQSLPTGTLALGEPVWSPDRTRILVSGGQTPKGAEDVNHDIYVIDPDGGNPLRLTDWEGIDALGNWSPDGERIVFVSDRAGPLRTEADNLDIYVMDNDGSNVIRLTDDPEHDIEPAWSPDGTQILFISMRIAGSELYVMNADGSSVTLLLEDPTGQLYRPAWSPDGTTIVYQQDPGPDLWLMNSDGTNRRNITNTPYADDGEAEWSLDGTQIVFNSDRTGNTEIWIMDADGSNLVQVTNHPSYDGYPDW
jgi:Tol biopolymer transport system component